MNKETNKEINPKLTAVILIIFTTLTVALLYFYSQNFPGLPSFSSPLSLPTEPSRKIEKTAKAKGIEKFNSQENFKDYLQQGALASFQEDFYVAELSQPERGVGIPKNLSFEGTAQTTSAELQRVSETNVQVAGIDEPDIVKTDGQEIYFSSEQRFWPLLRGPEEPGIIPRKIIPPFYQKPETKIIKGFPVKDLSQESVIEDSGKLLLSEGILMIFSNGKITGYNVSDPKKPEKKWEVKLENRSQIVSSRLSENKVYLVVESNINRSHPCPIKPLKISDKEVSISCQEIYHPVIPVPSDVIFSALLLNPSSGEIEKKVSFVGSQGKSVLYMAKNALYITYSYPKDIIGFAARFFQEKAQDLLPRWFIEKLRNLRSYDISQGAKLFELRLLFQQYQNSLNEDERLKIENELNNRLTDFYKKNKRELEKTGIVKIESKNFEITGQSTIPGYPLNQFSLSEYQNNLRIASTIEPRFPWFGLVTNRTGESENDLYILDPNLKIIGSIQGLGVTERIYSVRFVEDKGYLVTFRQTDPFFVLDLSDPHNPKQKGELKIPGYSSYLHPITKEKILGVGKEGWQIKISLFDVSNPENPKELSKYILDEGWSEILKTHHAFLIDKKNQIFFLPASKGGYIFSYKNDLLKLEKAISQSSVKRALYINDYLYIISDNKITVLDERTWEKLKELEI